MGREPDQPPSPNTVDQLVAVNPYNPDILPDLENYVNDQVSSRTYSLDASLCLLRFYQFEPERLSAQIVARILIKTRRFRQFWEETAKSRHLVEAVPGFEQAMQSYAIHVLSLSYQKAPKAVLAEAINMEGPALDNSSSIKSSTPDGLLKKVQGRGQLVVIPQNEFHLESKKNAAESIHLDQITRIFPILG